MEPLFVNKEKIASLLPMEECIEVMEKMFHSLAAGECAQPLRSMMWLPDRTGLLGMTPRYAAKLGVISALCSVLQALQSKMKSHFATGIHITSGNF